jgi:hypothetical protein
MFPPVERGRGVRILHELPVVRADRPIVAINALPVPEGSPCDETRNASRIVSSGSAAQAEAGVPTMTASRITHAFTEYVERSRAFMIRPPDDGPRIITPAKMRRRPTANKGRLAVRGLNPGDRRTGLIFRLAAPSRTRRPGRQQAGSMKRRSR